MTGNPLAAAVQEQVAVAVAAAEERAWHDGWAAAWRRCAEVIAEAIEADAGSHECAFGFDAAALAREIGARAVRPAGRVRRGVRDGSPAFEREAPSDSPPSAVGGRKPLDAYPSDQTASQTP